MYMYNIYVGVYIIYYCINIVLVIVCYVFIIGVLMRYKIGLINMIFNKKNLDWIKNYRK